MNDFGQDRTAECIPGCRLSLLKRIFKRILGLSANTYTHVCASSDCTMCVLFSFSFGCIVFERVAVINYSAHTQPSPPNSSAITLAFSQAWKSDPGLRALWHSARVRFVEDGRMNALQTMAASSAVSLPYRPMWGSGDADSPVSLSNVVSVTEVVRWKAACYT